MKKGNSGLAFLAGLGLGLGLSTFVKIKVAKKKAEADCCECDETCEDVSVDPMEDDGLKDWGVDGEEEKAKTEYDMINDDVTEEVREQVTAPIEDEKLDQFLAEANLENDEK